MAGIGSLVDLLLFYTLERVLFNRMVMQMGKNPQLVKMAIALWLMLEEIGYRDLTRMIHSFDDSTIEGIFNEALLCLQCIQPGSSEPLESEDADTVFASLFDEPMNRRFFYYNREFMYTRFNHVMETVCEKIFGERSAIEIDPGSGLDRPSVRPGLGDGSGSSSSGEMIGSSSRHAREEVRRRSALNPHASEFVPGQTREETRTMFLTFSKGYPLTRQEILNFFTTKWGDVVQNVVVEQPTTGQPPLYGRVIFKSAMTIPEILNGQDKAKFVVGRKHLWARIYVPRTRS